MPLTRREEQVADLLCEGLSNKLIAERIRLSEHTIKFHIENIGRKLSGTSSSNRVLSAVLWTKHRLGLYQIPEAPAAPTMRANA